MSSDEGPHSRRPQVLMAVFVADASATLAWCFEDETNNWTDGLLDRLQHGDRIVVPAHWPTEILNGLLVASRRKRISQASPFSFGMSSRACPSRRSLRLPTFKAKGSWLSVKSTVSQCMTRRTWSWLIGANCPLARWMRIYAKRHKQRA
jgi:hypothetical protein